MIFFLLLPVFFRYPSCRPSLNGLLCELRALMPRYYSVSSCSSVEPSSIHIAFSVLKNGLCTTWLHNLTHMSDTLAHATNVIPSAVPPTLMGYRISPSNPGRIQIPVFLRKGGNFKPPSDLKKPIIMIGPGTV